MQQKTVNGNFGYFNNSLKAKEKAKLGLPQPACVLIRRKIEDVDAIAKMGRDNDNFWDSECLT